MECFRREKGRPIRGFSDMSDVDMARLARID